ncbi:MAG: DUF2141 domain-containing protein [Desulfobulbaceae bacterium]|nr:DUF2141 domain-containing protein [Desulfobulbaceae bacterium]
MSKVIGIGAVLFLCLAPVASGTEQDNHQGLLRIEVNGLVSDQGVMKIALLNSAAAFAAGEEYFRQVRLPIENHRAIWLLTGIPFGEYAVKLYQDKNGNYQLDTVPLLGIPLEPYGFSNNVRHAFGPPDFAEARFLVDRDETNLNIIAK